MDCYFFPSDLVCLSAPAANVLFIGIPAIPPKAFPSLPPRGRQRQKRSSGHENNRVVEGLVPRRLHLTRSLSSLFSLLSPPRLSPRLLRVMVCAAGRVLSARQRPRRICGLRKKKKKHARRAKVLVISGSALGGSGDFRRIAASERARSLWDCRRRRSAATRPPRPRSS